MNTVQKIGKYEAIALLIVITINQIILNLSNTIISSTGSSAWINVIYISIIAILFCFLICKLFKPFPSNDIIDVSNYLGGKWLKTIIGILYISFFIFVCAIILRYLANSLKLIYFENSPIVFLLILFLLPVIIAGRFGIKSVSQVNLMLIPALLLSMLVILFSTAKDFIPERIYPIMGFGFNETFLIGLNNIFAFGCFGYIYFLIPILKHTNEFKTIVISSTIISAIYLFLSVICLTMMFPFISFTDEMFSMYLIARMIEFGKFFQRIDAIFIFIWILSTISFITFTSVIITNIFKKLTGIKNAKEMLYSAIAIIFTISLSIKSIAHIRYLENIIFKYWVIILIFVITPIILILANLKHKRRNQHET